MEPQDEPLVGPECRKRLEADELAYGKFDRLPPLEDRHNDVGAEEGERQNAADLTIVNTDLARQARNRLVTFGIQLMQSPPRTADCIDKAGVDFGRPLRGIADDEAGFHPAASNLERQGENCDSRRFR